MKIKNIVSEGWKEDSAAHDEFLAHARQQLQAADPAERMALAVRLSNLEKKHFGDEVGQGWSDTGIGRPNTGLSAGIEGILRTIGNASQPNVQNLPFGTVTTTPLTPEQLAARREQQRVEQEEAARREEQRREEIRRRREQDQANGEYEDDDEDEFSIDMMFDWYQSASPEEQQQFIEYFAKKSQMSIEDTQQYWEYVMKAGENAVEPEEWKQMQGDDLYENTGAVDAKGRTQQQWMQAVKQKFPDAKIMRAKMIDGPCQAMLPDGRKLSWNKVEQGVSEGFSDFIQGRLDGPKSAPSDVPMPTGTPRALRVGDVVDFGNGITRPKKVEQGTITAIKKMPGGVVYTVKTSAGQEVDLDTRMKSLYLRPTRGADTELKIPSGAPISRNQGVEEARASTAAFRQGNSQRAELNAMSPEERKAHEDKRAEQQRKRDDARLERERQRNAAKKGVAEGNKFFKPGPATTGKFPEPRERKPGQAWSKSETLGKDGKIYHWQDPRAKQDVLEGSGERKRNALWAQITSYEKRAKETKNDIKRDHLMKMASELRAKLPTTDEQKLDETLNDLAEAIGLELEEVALNEFAPGGNSASSYYAVTANFVNEFAQQKQEEIQDLIDAGWTKQDLAQAGTQEGAAADIAHLEQVRDGFLKGLKPGFDAYLQGDTQMKDQLGASWIDNDLPLNQDWEKIYGEPWGDDGEFDEGVAEGLLNEFSLGGDGDDTPKDDPYKYPKPEQYRRSIDFFGKFEANHFDKEDMDDATGVFKGYWYYGNNLKQIAYFKFDNPRRTGSNDPGMGWYYEPQDEDLDEGKPEKPEQPEADYGDDYQDMVARVKKLAGMGPLKTVYDPVKRVYKNVPAATQPGAKK